jgi:hypothetical protein
VAKLITKAADGLSKIPGMVWVVAVVSYFYVAATGLELEKSWERVLGVAAGCALIHWAASWLDAPYKLLYDADRKHKFSLPFLNRLDKARDSAAQAIFRFDKSVIDYKHACDRGYITTDPSKPGLYAYAKTVARDSGDWEGLVILLLDLSKASRTLSLAAAGAAIALWFGWISVTSTVDSFLFDPLFLLTGVVVLLFGGFILRGAHQIVLYRRVAPVAAHAALSDGRLLLVSNKYALVDMTRQATGDAVGAVG